MYLVIYLNKGWVNDGAEKGKFYLGSQGKNDYNNLVQWQDPTKITAGGTLSHELGFPAREWATPELYV